MNHIPVKALIFDMDGTMVDSMPHHWISWVEFVKKHGVDISLDTQRQSWRGRT